MCAALGRYATASASSSLYFALNFGDEGKVDSRRTPALLTDLNRRRSDQILGLPSLHRPRNPADLRCSALLLGPRLSQSDSRRTDSTVIDREPANPRRHRLLHRRRPPSNRPPPLHLTAALLPPTTRQDSQLLSVSASPQTHSLDVHIRHLAELLPFRALWTKLGLSLEFSPCADMGVRPSGGPVLRWGLDSHVVNLR